MRAYRNNVSHLSGCLHKQAAGCGATRRGNGKFLRHRMLLLPDTLQPLLSRIMRGRWTTKPLWRASAKRRRCGGSRGTVTTQADDTTNVARLGSGPTSSFLRDLLNDLREAVRREKDELVVAVEERKSMADDLDVDRRELAALKKLVAENDATLVVLKD